MNSGNEYGSLSYGLMNDVGEYIVFANSLDGSVVTADGAILTKNINIVGNGPDKTSVVSSGKLGYNSGSAIYITMTGVGISFNSDAALDGILTINNCLIHDSDVTYQVVWQRSGATINGSTFYNNYSAARYVIYSFAGCDITNCLFINNSVGINTGAVIKAYSATTNIDNCYFSNSTNSHGYIVDAISTSLVNISGSTFETPADTIRADTGATVSFSGVNIVNSTVSGAGNIVFADDAVLTSTIPEGSTIGTGVLTLKQTALKTGSGVVTIQNITITNSVCTVNNSGFFRTGNFINCMITGNTSNLVNGSVIRMDYSTKVSLTGCTVANNTTQRGDMYVFNGVVDLKDSYVSHIWSASYPPQGMNFILHVSGTVYTNMACIDEGRQATIRIDADSRISGSYACGQSYISIGNYTDPDDMNSAWTVGGSASVVTTGGSTALSGIGTYINADGTNDFSPVYTVTNTDASGSGSLLYGLVGSTKYVVVSHSVTSCSAVLNTNVNRVLHICTGDGRTIVGGSVSIPNASTVSVNTTVDEHGAAQVAGSTVTVEGGTTTLSGNVQLSGTLKPVGGIVLVNDTTVSGVGAGAVVDFNLGCRINRSGNFTVNNVTFLNGRPADDSVYGGVVKSDGRQINFSGCTFSNCVGTEGAVRVYAGASTISNCVFSNNTSGDIGGNGPFVITNCVCPKGIYVSYNGTASISGTTSGRFSLGYTSSYAVGTIILSGFNRLTGGITGGRSASDPGIIHIVAGSTLSLYGTSQTTTVNSNTTGITAYIVAEGNASQSCTIINNTNIPVTVYGGTYHNLYINGTME